MKIQILSDLHLDINQEHPFSLADSDTFTVICGDISGFMNDTVKWIGENVKNGVFVEGNHIGYNFNKHSIQYIQQKLEEQFPISANVSYLNDMYKVVDDVVFVGGILWTDYRLGGESMRIWNMQIAESYMNDFKYNHYNIAGTLDNYDNENGATVRRLRPQNCETMHYKTLNAIKYACEQFPDKKIVVVTHHAPHEKSIGERYVNSKANASYVSDLSEFIMNHPNIKLWCHGHIHSNSDYMIGDCRVVCNPRGYEMYKENKDFNSRFIIEI